MKKRTDWRRILSTGPTETVLLAAIGRELQRIADVGEYGKPPAPEHRPFVDPRTRRQTTSAEQEPSRQRRRGTPARVPELEDDESPPYAGPDGEAEDDEEEDD